MGGRRDGEIDKDLMGREVEEDGRKRVTKSEDGGKRKEVDHQSFFTSVPLLLPPLFHQKLI